MTIIGDYKTKLTCHEAPGASKNAPVACFMWKCIPEPGLPVSTQALKAEKRQNKTSSKLGSQTHQQIVSPKKFTIPTKRQLTSKYPRYVSSSVGQKCWSLFKESFCKRLSKITTKSRGALSLDSVEINTSLGIEI